MFKTKSSKFIGLLAIAGLAVGSGAAFTASNNFTAQPAIVAGFGSVSVTGATVTNTAVTPLSTDPSQVSEVVFTTTTDVMTEASTVTFSNTVASVETVVAVYSCSPSVIVAATTWAITCDTTASPTSGTFGSSDPTYAGFDQIGLTVS
jgi:hypothetical protein